MRAVLLVPMLVLAAVAIAALDEDSGLLTWARLREDVRLSQAEIERLAAANASLRREVEALRSEPAALERAIREELGWARPGEVVIRFGDGPRDGAAPSTGSIGASPRNP